MTNLSTKIAGKTFVALVLSFSILIAGVPAIPGQTAHAATSTATFSDIYATAIKKLGVPYKMGAEWENDRKFDCSAFVQYVFKQNGIKLPRTSKQQSKVGKYVPRNQLKPGDLVFFYSPIHHVGIYIGNGKFIHTYGKPGVTISNLNSGWWDKHYTTARRVL